MADSETPTGKPPSAEKQKNDEKLEIERILLSDFIRDRDIKVADFAKSARKFKNEFEDELLDFRLNKINNDDQFLVERLLEIVPKHVDARNRKFSKKLVNAIGSKYGLNAELFPPEFSFVDQFLRKQASRVEDLKAKARKEIDFGDSAKAKEIENDLSLELNLVRLLTHFVFRESWFDFELVARLLSPFKDTGAKSDRSSVGEAASNMVGNKNSTAHLLALASEHSDRQRQSERNAQSLNQSISQYQAKLTSREGEIVTLEAQVKELSAQIHQLSQQLDETKAEQKTDREVVSIGKRESRGHIQKTVSGLLNYDIDQIVEMLSDGDEFHNMVLEQIERMKHKLEELRRWSASSE